MPDSHGAEYIDQLRRLIRVNGPIPLSQFMGESNARYYDSRDPLGAEADFITAPEISQMFGELIGLWLTDLWSKAGRPERCHYVELGPGRGTLAADALRAMAQHGLQPQVHFVEGSTALRDVQSAAVPSAIHHHDVASLPEDGSILLVANEFFDALPIRQLICTDTGWRERLVGLEGESLAFVAGDRPMDAAVPEIWRSSKPGTIVETNPASAAIASEIADRLVGQGGAALMIDYGAEQLRAGSTLQAIKAHQKMDVFASPGEADLTAHVDFGTLADVASRQGAKVMGITTQGEWLIAMGIDARASALSRQSPVQAEVIQRQRDRLTGPDQMGALFKVMGWSAPQWPDGAGFGAE
ncbi:MAG: SAM-dependent methyltransferase [Erythrobacter sp.]